MQGLYRQYSVVTTECGQPDTSLTADDENLKKEGTTVDDTKTASYAISWCRVDHRVPL